MTFDDWKGVAELASYVATVLAIAIGGLWTYLLFVKNREKFPQASVSHQVIFFDLAEGIRVIHVAIRIENTGKVLLSLPGMECRLLQVLPLSGSIAERARTIPPSFIDKGNQKIRWPMIDDRVWTFTQGDAELEPGESEMLRCDFVIDGTPTLVQVYSHLPNPAKKVIGWACLSQIDLNKKENADATESPEA